MTFVQMLDRFKISSTRYIYSCTIGYFFKKKFDYSTINRT